MRVFLARQISLGSLGVLIVASAWTVSYAGQAPQTQRREFYMSDLPKSVQLTAEQEARVVEIRQRAIRDIQNRGGASPSPQDRLKLADLGRQKRQAAQDGDDAKLQELQTEMDALPFVRNLRQMQEDVDRQIIEILTPGQRQRFGQWQKIRHVPTPLIDDPEVLCKAVQEIPNLSDRQKKRVAALYDDYERAAAQADEVARTSLAARFAEEVTLVLRPSQMYLLTVLNLPMGEPNRPAGAGVPTTTQAVPPRVAGSIADPRPSLAAFFDAVRRKHESAAFDCWFNDVADAGRRQYVQDLVRQYVKEMIASYRLEQAMDRAFPDKGEARQLPGGKMPTAADIAAAQFTVYRRLAIIRWGSSEDDGLPMVLVNSNPYAASWKVSMQQWYETNRSSVGDAMLLSGWSARAKDLTTEEVLAGQYKTAMGVEMAYIEHMSDLAEADKRVPTTSPSKP